MKIDLNKDVHASNNAKALEVHEFLSSKGIKIINLVGSPGSGKTTLLESIIKCHGSDDIGVIEGDLFGDLDHQRIERLGVQSYQLNTEGACHLEASFLDEALEHFDYDKMKYMFIDNIGNLICTASYYLGEDLRIIVSSTTEGNDKPYKYPKMFYTSDIVVLNKIDLLPYIDFDVEKFDKAIENFECQSIHVCAKTSENIDKLCEMIFDA